MLTTAKYCGSKFGNEFTDGTAPTYRVGVISAKPIKHNINMLQDKIKQSVALLRKVEPLALELNPQDGIYLAFSGGKDSQCIMELAKMAGVKFKAWYSVTGIDSPQNVRFIMENYPEVNFVHHRKNFLRLVEEKGLPMMNSRFCCERLKENLGAGNVMIDGIRADESRKRAAYAAVMVRSRRKENIQKGRNRTYEEIAENQHRCIKGKDRIDIHPILEWSESDVWQFIAQQRIPYNPTYQKLGRVGCMYCPYASRQQIVGYMEQYPLYYKRIMKALAVFLEKKPLFDTPEQYTDWWMSGMTMEKYRQTVCGGR